MSERKLLAIMFTDVVGYSTSMSANEKAAIGILQKCRPILRGAIERYNGSFLKEIGDGTLSSFPSAIEAVLCALEIQHMLRGENDFRIRIGIHVGDVIRENNDVFGDGVNIAARIEPQAEPGGICVSSQVRELIRNKPFLKIAAQGAKSLKGIAGPMELFSVAGDVDGPEFKELREQILVARPASPKGGFPLAWVLAAAGLLCLIAAAGWFTHRHGYWPFAATAKEARQKGTAVAVMPFANLSESSEDAYFGDGLTEDLTTAIASIPGLKTAARSTMFAIKEKSPDARELGRELGVSHVLEGSVRKAGKRIRVNAQLIETDKGKTVWARKFDKELAGIFAIQDDIVKSIVTELDVHLVSGEQARLWRASTKNPEAYDLYLRAVNSGGTQEDFSGGQALLDQALALDPDFTAALCLKGFTLIKGFGLGFIKDPMKAFPQADSAFQKALKVDDRCADAHAGRGFILFIYKKYTEAEAEFELALSLGPTMEYTHILLTIFYAQKKDYPKALQFVRRAKELSRTPDSQAYAWEIVILKNMGRLEEAYAVSQSAMELWPNSLDIVVNNTNICRLLNRKEDVARGVKRILELKPDFSIERWLTISGLYTKEEVAKLVAEWHKVGLP
jgi:TolB-like protein/class 3 adenylate cyclase